MGCLHCTRHGILQKSMGMLLLLCRIRILQRSRETGGKQVIVEELARKGSEGYAEDKPGSPP